MSKQFLGDLCAYIKRPTDDKAQYPRIGTVFTDERGQISVKIDTMPLDPAWTGWCNVFPRQANAAQGTPYNQPGNNRDDEPF